MTTRSASALLRSYRKTYRDLILGLTDTELVYFREEVAREEKRRRLEVRGRRAAKRHATVTLPPVS